MGQELLEIEDSLWRRNNARTYYVATSSKGYMVLRGSHADKYTHATIVIEPHERSNGYVWASFTSQEKYAKRYAKAGQSEAVELKKITAKEYRQLKKEIDKKAEEWRELQARTTAQVYQIDRTAV